jgi:hypothetical protein
MSNIMKSHLYVHETGVERGNRRKKSVYIKEH